MENNSAHILVVDDDNRLRSLLQRFLRDNGFYVSVAKNAAEARERLRDYKFDLLIVDIMMPEETGLEFLEKLRRESSGAGHHADRHGRNRRPVTGFGSRRRRLSAQTV